MCARVVRVLVWGCVGLGSFEVVCVHVWVHVWVRVCVCMCVCVYAGVGACVGGHVCVCVGGGCVCM